MKVGYVEEWWWLELKKALLEKNKKLEDFGISSVNFNKSSVGFENAVLLSNELEIPLHPDFIFYWSQISK